MGHVLRHGSMLRPREEIEGQIEEKTPRGKKRLMFLDMMNNGKGKNCQSIK